MSLQHFFLKDQQLKDYCESANNEDVALNLDKEDFHHAKVLRLQIGEHIGVIDSVGDFYECEIRYFSECIKVNIVRHEFLKNLNNCSSVDLFVGGLKSNKIETVIRSCTEVGISKFIPTLFERSIVKLDEKKSKSKLERWKKIIKSAAMQSGCYAIPSISDLIKFRDACELLSTYDYVFIFWEECRESKNLFDICRTISAGKKIAIVIGPEGGITKEEIDKILKSNKSSFLLSLGSSILRSETACICAAFIVKYCLSC